MIGLTLLGLLLALGAPTQAGGLPAGNWQIAVYLPDGSSEQIVWLLKVETNGDNASAAVMAASPSYNNPKVVSFEAKGESVRAVFKTGNTELVFSGKSSKDSKKITGSYEQLGGPVLAATMTPTELHQLNASNMTRNLGIEGLANATTMVKEGPSLRQKAAQTKGAEAKQKLIADADAADKLAIAALPTLCREVIGKHPGTYAAEHAAMLMLQLPKDALQDNEAKELADTAGHVATQFGPAWEVDANSHIVAALIKRGSPAGMILEYAKKAEAALTPHTPAITQISVIQQLMQALTETGTTAGLKALDARLDRLEPEVVRVTPYQGRKEKSQRVAVMELFTGAQCPPCVAADLAFGALEHTYKTSELVLIQYHLHIPGPDPMTNADTEARAKYYGARSTPSTFFNGISKAGGGGPMATAQAKYHMYCDVINPLLEVPAACALTASAQRVGDKIRIAAEVKELQKATPDLRLRMVLVEQNIRFIGSNKLRFHHHVVRALPGGVDGVRIDNTQATTAEVDLTDLRKVLIGYLANFAATKRPFPQPERPLDFNHLRVIAFVQDDATKGILQAVQVDVRE
jgi:hypothetical protein